MRDRLMLILLGIVGSTSQVIAYPVNQSSAVWEMSQTYLSQLPNPIPPRTTEPPPELPSQPEKPNLETPPTQPTPTPREEIPGQIRVERFEFVGNTAFSDEELSQVVNPFTQREITFAELLQAEEAVTNLYVTEGYINSGAVIKADQTLSPEAAVVTITIIEGGIEEIKVTGTKRLNPDYVSSRLALATQKPLNTKHLLEALQLLQLDPLIENISMSRMLNLGNILICKPIWSTVPCSFPSNPPCSLMIVARCPSRILPTSVS
jgi:hemolysin activation/secretion protein